MYIKYRLDERDMPVGQTVGWTSGKTMDHSAGGSSQGSSDHRSVGEAQ